MSYQQLVNTLRSLEPSSELMIVSQAGQGPIENSSVFSIQVKFQDGTQMTYALPGHLLRRLVEELQDLSHWKTSLNLLQESLPELWEGS